MRVFNYKQYLSYIHKVRLNAVLQLAEEGETYQLEKQYYTHDKLIKKILKEKNEVANLINDFLHPKELIHGENLEKYTNSYITKKYKNKEADLVYKLRDKDIFFLIEHQSTIDNKIPYRILNYCVGIIQEWCRNKKIKKSTLYPIVVPILIYTGDVEWKIPRNFKDKQIGDYIFENYNIELSYNLIDINKIPDVLLLKKGSMLAYVMLLEKIIKRLKKASLLD